MLSAVKRQDPGPTKGRYAFQPVPDRPGWWRVFTPGARWDSGSPPTVREALEFPVLIRLGQAADGRLGCIGLELGDERGAEISARALRRLPLGHFLASLASWLREAPDDLPYFAAMKEAMTAAPFSGSVPHPGPKGHPRTHFERVAARYRQLLVAAPRRPVKALADELYASEPTVRRWLQRARDMGLLGASQQGKAGEKPEESDGDE